MRLAGVRDGDIVRFGGMYAIVLERGRGRATVRVIGRPLVVRRIRADEIEAHWRRAGARARAEASR